ncbi:hypothetical protein AN9450.2 [Aspergillus nidulans FGSC A4]|uniref:Uncharacterized protein n=1 Tax=Emericella nidulans (strain FGSC A4 / ATCC 38163 / CBS 112.46 / NRRL 194 / M139) TaxID=227321 RepID=Q5AQI0_EMENI|nr:hypothetical protein [Aspergillus nidulans FGSC A4]EAA66809.1 hypothetical protein AN9450.2 [Aspergillus nidulans FGSC A4]CBF89795.1 TPA: hypothetical protein ANIA_09450 [Aspergillus nidulans FGSC A4]|eukprot:XP_868832.1 hypothetical protein AN9450.2 [Aspergillus nidulans FGSC A4]
MKVSLVTLTSVLALVAAQDSSSSSESSTETSTAPTTTPSLTAAERCALNCGDNDLCCVAACYSVPCPSDQQANNTNTCVSQCDQGDGSEEDIQAYAECQARCISSTYFPGTVTVTSAPTGSSTGSNTATTTSSGDDADSTDDSNSDDSSATSTNGDEATATGSGDEPSDTNAAARLGVSAAGLAGLLMAAWAL